MQIEHTRIDREEIANSITHGLGLFLSVVGGSVLLFMASVRGETSHLLSCAVYVSTLLFLYGTSTLYHWAVWPRLKHFLRILDHVGIFLLIAGTSTPFSLVLIRGGWGWAFFAFVWGFALLGILFKVFSIKRFRESSTALYLIMGWLGGVFVIPVLHTIPMGALLYLIGGGLCYTAGMIFFLWERLPYNHSVWHLFVLAGSLLHYLAILQYVLP